MLRGRSLLSSLCIFVVLQLGVSAVEAKVQSSAQLALGDAHHQVQAKIYTERTWNVRTPLDDPQRPIKDPDSYNTTRAFTQ